MTAATIKVTVTGSGDDDDGVQYMQLGAFYCPKWYSENEVGWNYIELTVFLVIVVIIIVVVIVIAVLACKYKKAKKNNVSAMSQDG